MTEPFTILDMSQARHQFNRFPKYFENEGAPILIEHKGELSMALCDIEIFMMLSGMSQFIREQGLDEAYEEWYKLEQEADDDGEEDEEDDLPLMDRTEVRAGLAKLLKEDLELRKNYLANLDETRQWAQQVISEIEAEEQQALPV